MEPEPIIPARIRTFCPGDSSACQRLYAAGLVDGRGTDNDTGADMDRIEQAYLRAGGHFWVAESVDPASAGTVVGMVGVQQEADGSAEVRRLRVDERHRRRGIGTALVDRALRFCHENGNLRIILDTYMEREPAIRLFEKFQFRHGRTRRVGERDLLYFYLDLYGTPGGR